jgi:hypothetical protein
MKMIRFLSVSCLLILGFLFSARAQSPCLVKDTIEKDIAIFKSSLLKSHAFIARIQIATCYNQEQEIICTISRQYRIDSETASEEKIKKHGQKLYLINVSYSPLGKFEFAGHIDNSVEVRDGDLVVFNARKDATWQQQEFSATLKFRYEVKDENKEGEITLSFKLPDNLTKEIAENDSGSIQANVTSPDANKKKAKVEEPKQTTTQPPEAVSYTAMDSIKFYYNKIGDLASLVSEKKSSDKAQLSKFIIDCNLTKNRFDEHVNNAGSSANALMYKDEFYNFYDYIGSELNGITAEGMLKEETASDDNPKSGNSSSKGFLGISSSTENLIVYLLITAIGLSLLGFLYFKFRK